MAASPSRFGFVEFAETWNGRLAMLGFVIGPGTELLTGQGILSQIEPGLIAPLTIVLFGTWIIGALLQTDLAN
jgi:ferrochelatase